MSFPNSHKTVFVLDHGPHFAQPCHPVEFDVQRARGDFYTHNFIQYFGSGSVFFSPPSSVTQYSRIRSCLGQICKPVLRVLEHFSTDSHTRIRIHGSGSVFNWTWVRILLSLNFILNFIFYLKLPFSCPCF